MVLCELTCESKPLTDDGLRFKNSQETPMWISCWRLKMLTSCTRWWWYSIFDISLTPNWNAILSLRSVSKNTCLHPAVCTAVIIALRSDFLGPVGILVDLFGVRVRLLVLAVMLAPCLWPRRQQWHHLETSVVGCFPFWTTLTTL